MKALNREERHLLGVEQFDPSSLFTGKQVILKEAASHVGSLLRRDVLVFSSDCCEGNQRRPLSWNQYEGFGQLTAD